VPFLTLGPGHSVSSMTGEAATVPMNVATASGLPPRELADLRDTLTALPQSLLGAH